MSHRLESRQLAPQQIGCGAVSGCGAVDVTWTVNNQDSSWDCTAIMEACSVMPEVELNGSAVTQDGVLTDLENHKTTTAPTQKHQDTWFFPKEFSDDLIGISGLSARMREEVLNTAWEYSRVVIPQYSNWTRFCCYVRLSVIGIVAEYNGEWTDITASSKMLGYDVDELLDTMLMGRPGAEESKNEYRTYLLVTSAKSSGRRDDDLFRRYVNHLARSPKIWFRARDGDALIRFGLAAALSSNDIDNVWFTEDQLQVLGEICVTLYDAVAFFKHRSEGEIHNTFAYLDLKLRADAYRRAREVLWSIDSAWGMSPRRLVALNHVRFFGGPMHMTMRRYRYVENGLELGRPETEDMIKDAREYYKLWYRVDARETFDEQQARFASVIERRDYLLFPGLAELLEEDVKRNCDQCVYSNNYGARGINEFGGVKLCERCSDEWRRHSETLPQRAAEAFPEIDG
ncbi:hypothetical protein B0H67DRAFT_672419 [Lasiosphaeris hirsuta]|uniref:ABA 3 protein n=1 Tax=Lasiosphaeris hirsuta TaxID=260670 RepID=A0AA40DP84_9PEZI|nr:hypothetical protein B0H67DRAFT_672419 [Lasiosphaeris hirsuta]